MYTAKNLIGQKFGMLTVLSRVGTNSNGESTWECLCTCGNKTITSGTRLCLGRTKSCGHLQKLQRPPKPFKHGLSPRSGCTPEYNLWKHAKRRAREQHVPFALEISDIVIPAVCPITGIAMSPNTGRPKSNSPTLDKLIPEQGYVKDNVWVISFRANAFKSDFTIEQLEKYVLAIKERLAK